MNKQVIDTLGDAIAQTADSGPKELHQLAKDLAIWATIHTINEEGSKLRERGYALAGAIVDWAHELYPDFGPS